MTFVARDFFPGDGRDFYGIWPSLSPTYSNVFAVQTLTDLAALDVPADKSAAYVEDEFTWFFFDAQSTATADGTNIILPDSLSPSDPGRWLRDGAGGGGAISTNDVSNASVVPGTTATDAFNSLSNLLEDIFLVRDSVGGVNLNVTTAVSVPFDTLEFSSSAYSWSNTTPDQVTINESGVYRLVAATVLRNQTTRRSEVEIFFRINGTTDLPTKSIVYLRGANADYGSAKLDYVAQFIAGDTISLMGRRVVQPSAGTAPCLTQANGSFLMLWKVRD